jgi:polysaccharide pyruvyl transferase WcaK-like protein
VALRPWGGTGESPVAAYARLLPLLEARCGARVVLLPMHHPDDLRFAEEVAERTGAAGAFPIVRSVYPPDALLGVFGRMQAVVAMRLHALIFAARMAVPPFALAYDPKIESLMQGLGLTDSLEHWRGFDPEEVAERVAALFAAREVRAATLRAQAEALEARALRNADSALNLYDTWQRGRKLISSAL